MKDITLLYAVGEIDDDLIEQASDHSASKVTAPKKNRGKSILKWTALAACLVLIACAYPAISLIIGSFNTGALISVPSGDPHTNVPGFITTGETHTGNPVTAETGETHTGDPVTAETGETHTGTPVTSGTGEQHGGYGQGGGEAQFLYLYFEELLKYPTDFIIGELLSLTKKDEHYYFTFSVKKDYRDNGFGAEVVVQVDVSENIADLTYPTYGNPMTVGKSYYLLLDRYSPSVYSESEDDIFAFVNDSLCIPADAAEDGAFLYGTDLKDHFKTQEALSAFSSGRFDTFILEKIKDNPLRRGTEYIRSDDVQTIIRLSDYVLTVKVNGLYDESFTGDRLTGSCVVENVLKGEVENTTVTIIFPGDKVEKGSSYIVALDKTSKTSTIFILSSKNSIFDISEYDRITSYID